MRITIVAIALGWVLCFGAAPLFSQQRATFAPTIPDGFQPVDLFVRERGGASDIDIPLEVLRYGMAGTLERPGTLVLPDVGRSIALARWDWLRPEERPLELIERDSYETFVVLLRASEAILLSETEIYLLWGAAEWRAQDQPSGPAPTLYSADYAISGRGRARTVRAVDRITIEVTAGRFEVMRGAQLVAVVGAGQSRSIPLAEPFAGSRQNSAADFENRTIRLEERLSRALAILLESEPGRESLDGETLSQLWESVEETAPELARARETRAGWVVAPDLVERQLGTAVRLLSSFAFEVPARDGL